MYIYGSDAAIITFWKFFWTMYVFSNEISEQNHVQITPKHTKFRAFNQKFNRWFQIFNKQQQFFWVAKRKNHTFFYLFWWQFIEFFHLAVASNNNNNNKTLLICGLTTSMLSIHTQNTEYQRKKKPFLS